MIVRTALPLLLIGLGLALVARTIAAGIGGGLGLFIGVLLVAAGGTRLYVGRRV